MAHRSLSLLSAVVLAAACGTAGDQASATSPSPAAVSLGAHVDVGEDGLALAAGGARLRTVSLGREGCGEACRREVRHRIATSTVEGASLALVGAGIDEWYRRTPHGLEQGFTLPARPAGVGPLRLTMTVDGAAVTVPSPRRAMLEIGDERVHYGHLAVFDAEGRRVPAHLEGGGRTLAIVVDDAGATYPLTIDPLLWVDILQLTPATPTAGGNFGASIVVDGANLIVGAPSTSPDGVVVELEPDGLGGWVEAGQIQPTEADFNQKFGRAIAIDGDVLAVGAPEADFPVGGSTHGALYIYDRNGGTWSGIRVPDHPDLSTSAKLGTSVAVSGDTVVAGAPGDQFPTAIVSAGAVYVYRFTTGSWSLEERIQLPDGDSPDDFGFAVALHEDTLFVGADGRTVGATSQAGTVEVFERVGSAWTHTETLQSPSPVTAGNFGISLATDGTTLLIGERRGAFLPSRLELRSEVGGSWGNVDASFDDPLVTTGLYSRAVSVEGDVALAGDAVANDNEGRATLFSRQAGTWTISQSVPHPAPTMMAGFGRGVATDGTRAFIGAESQQVGGVFGGAVFVFALVGEACTSPGDCGSGHCVDGFCCDTACDDACARCDAPGLEGQCQPLTDGEPGTCSPNLCDGTSLDCPTTCATIDDCTLGFFCDEDTSTCTALFDDGTPCDSAAECASDHCVDGVCCDGPCTEQCRACDAPSAPGACVPIAGPPRGGRPPCEADSCTNGVASVGSTCDGGDTCSPLTEVVCDPYLCDGDRCFEECTLDAQCTSQTLCIDRECVSGAPTCTTSVISRSDGTTTDCAPYLCESGEDGCPTSCTTTAQCVAGFVCDSQGRCTNPQPVGVTDVSCACRLDGAPPRPSPPRWCLLFGLAAFLRRRARSAPQSA